MKKVGVILEGEGEILAIESVIKKLNLANNIIQRPLRADLQPKANPKVIARSAESAVKLCRNRGVNKVLILIDGEDHECACKLAQDIKTAFGEVYRGFGIDFSVVVKDSMIENWLIADIAALRQMTARYEVSKAFENAVSQDKADSVRDPVGLLNSIAKKKEYRKGDDPSSICQKQDPLRASLNSRSYRKFLREVGCTAYAKQSKFPYNSPRLNVKKKSVR